MTKKIVQTAPIYSMGEKVGTYRSVTYVTMTQQEANARLAGITIVAVIALLIIQSII